MKSTLHVVVFVFGAIQGCDQHTTAGHAWSLGEGGTGGDTPTPSITDLTKATCIARSACDDPRCSEAVACQLHLVRSELRRALADCLADGCATFDDCRAAIGGGTPPTTFGRFRDGCLEAAARCGDEASVPLAWCDDASLAEDAYAKLHGCLELPCDEVLPCFRTAVFADAPRCTSL